MSDAAREAQIRGNLNAMRRSHGLPQSAGPSLPAQQWWVDDLAERQAELDEAKRRILRAARSISLAGCDRKCRPARVGWFRHRSERHTDLCGARTRFSDAAKMYARLIGENGMQWQSQTAYEVELGLFHDALRKAGM